MVLYFSASSDVTDILESDQEQLNQLEKLRFDGKPVKIKRYSPGGALPDRILNAEAARLVLNS